MIEHHFYGEERGNIKAVNKTYKNINTLNDLYRALLNVWCKETCTPRLRGEWSEENLTVGQCSITAFLVQDIFGGDIYEIGLDNGGFHCFNKIDGNDFDLTDEQFGEERKSLNYKTASLQNRELRISKVEKRERYELLKNRLKEYVND